MGWVIMSERELNRVEVLAQVDDGRLSVDNAANMLDLTRRQIFRLLKRYRQDGASAIRHKARGKPPNNRIHHAKRDYALNLIKESYADFGPTLAAEMLAERHGFKVSRETVRKWMQEDGLWLSRKQRRTFHQPRLRRECFGELIQIDGSDHRWFEDRADPCTLLVFIDDATSTLMELWFVESESTFTYFDALESYLLKHGRPVAFYSDKHSVFRVAKPSKHMTGMTQFGRALAELNIEILCANSSQAKGRVERANRTLQDRLVKELRIAGVVDDILPVKDVCVTFTRSIRLGSRRFGLSKAQSLSRGVLVLRFWLCARVAGLLIVGMWAICDVWFISDKIYRQKVADFLKYISLTCVFDTNSASTDLKAKAGILNMITQTTTAYDGRSVIWRKDSVIRLLHV